jgi:hypothetical protein
MIKTMDSFLENCTDQHLIERWIAVDDGSDVADLYEISARYPFLEIIVNEYKGHASALNVLFESVDTTHVFHTEDDWRYDGKRNYITDCYDVMQQPAGDFTITCVTLRVYHKNEKRCYNDKQKPLITESGNQYRRRRPNSRWPGYTLNPSLQNLELLKRDIASDKIDGTGGLFNENKQGFEWGFAYRHRHASHETCQLLANNGYTNPRGLPTHIEHLGYGRTAYKLNKTYR